VPEGDREQSGRGRFHRLDQESKAVRFADIKVMSACCQTFEQRGARFTTATRRKPRFGVISAISGSTVGLPGGTRNPIRVRHPFMVSTPSCLLSRRWNIP
jgi:hypothetical protein